MKGKKKIVIIAGILVILLALIVGACFIFFYDGHSNDTNDKLMAPAINTEELLQEMETVEVTNVTEDEIVFSNDVELKENEKVAVWIYSEPKFLGYFEVMLENGVKKIAGLKEALENISIETGEHNIAITTESGEPIGYIDVQIQDNGQLTEGQNNNDKEENVNPPTVEKEENKTTTKEVTETVDINYTTTKQNEVNMQRGTTSVVQEGQKGKKNITYIVTYDSNGKEISREKKSEQITKQPVNRIEKVGISDYNINTAYITGYLMGVMCSEDQTITNPDGGKYCNDEIASKNFNSVTINDDEYLYMVDGANITPVKINNYKGNVYSGTYQGTLYYFDGRGGSGEQLPLTQELCTQYKLSCGAW